MLTKNTNIKCFFQNYKQMGEQIRVYVYQKSNLKVKYRGEKGRQNIIYKNSFIMRLWNTHWLIINDLNLSSFLSFLV